MEKEINKSVETYTMDNVEEVIRGLEWRLGSGELQSFYTLLDMQPFSGQFEFGFVRAMSIFKESIKDDDLLNDLDNALSRISVLQRMWQRTDEWHCSKGASWFLAMIENNSKSLEDFLKFMSIMDPMREEARERFFIEKKGL